ncbi:AzlD domain-containing protein [Pusillimonas sp.]|uniref:AzlD domain-containing protein n=1 Tax=Pusillimonas sp. TaxID=3040095 RepID=UPI0037CBBE0F
MATELWVSVIVIAIGTFLMRALPYVWMQRRLSRQNRRDASDGVPAWLIVLGPAMISAMFGVSLAPSSDTTGAWLATLCGIALTLYIWYRTKSLSWPVCGGVVMYAVVLILAA